MVERCSYCGTGLGEIRRSDILDGELCCLACYLRETDFEFTKVPEDASPSIEVAVWQYDDERLDKHVEEWKAA